VTGAGTQRDWDEVDGEKRSRFQTEGGRNDELFIMRRCRCPSDGVKRMMKSECCEEVEQR